MGEAKIYVIPGSHPSWSAMLMVVEAHRQPDAGSDLEVGGIRLAASHDALLDPALRPYIEQRPAGRLATQILPDFPGRTPPVFPPEWLEGLKA